MIEGALWRKWVFFYAPMALFLIFPAVPVLLDGDHLGAAGRRAVPAWNAINYNPFWTWKPTLGSRRVSVRGDAVRRVALNTMFIALASTAISLVCGVFAGYALSRAELSLRRQPRDASSITYLVPQTLLFIPLAEIIRNYRLATRPGR